VFLLAAPGARIDLPKPFVLSLRATSPLALRMQSSVPELIMLRTEIAGKPDKSTALDRRREERISIEFPIEVSGFNREGRFESESTSTQNVSGSSCSFHLKMEVERGMALAIRAMSSANGFHADSAPVLFYVGRVDPVPGGYCVGAVKLAPRAPWTAKIHEPEPSQKFLF
jgi:hypothetical protein